MPRDLEGARAWGLRLGLLGAPVAALNLFSPPATAGPSSPAGSVEMQDLRLKAARADLLELEKDLRTGKLLRLEDVQQRETAIAAEFRRCACEYPLRALAVLQRHVTDAAAVDRIVADLQPLAAELLNKADARQALRGKTRDEVRAVLTGWVDKVLESIAS